MRAPDLSMCRRIIQAFSARRDAERPKLSNPARETRGLQPRRSSRVRCSAWLGRVCLSEQIISSTCLVNKTDDAYEKAKHDEPHGCVNQLNAEPSPNWKPKQHEPVWKRPRGNQCPARLWHKPAVQSHGDTATPRLRMKPECVSVNVSRRTLALGNQIMESKTCLVRRQCCVNSKHVVRSGLTIRSPGAPL